MNMYLLLRDNKQSGPFSAEQMIAFGLKPYDLVWLEGKSAAWRYPSEIDELKAFSPSIEEQPYDRFYKKPDASPEAEKIKQAPTAVPARRAPKSVTPSRKVYINFPGDAAPVEVSVNPSKAVIAAKLPEYNELVQPVHAFDESSGIVRLDAPTIVRSRLPDRRLVLLIGGICILMVAVITVLALNSRSQRNDIRDLNDMIVRMEQRQREQNAAAQSYLASHPLHAPQPDPVDITEPVSQSTSSPSAPHAQPGTNAPANVVAGKPVENSAPATAVVPPAVNDKPRELPKKPATAPVDLSSQVSVRPNKYRTGLFGGVSGLQLVLINNSAKQLAEVSVEVRFLSRDKKVVKTQNVFFQKVSPGAQSVIDVPRSSRGVSVDYTITDIKS